MQGSLKTETQVFRLPSPRFLPQAAKAMQKPARQVKMRGRFSGTESRNMHYFSIHTPDDEHIGFMIMQPDEDAAEPPQSGRFAVRLNEGAAGSLKAAQVLRELQNEARLFWAAQADRVVLSDESHESIGHIRQQYLRLHGQDFLLNDLTGTL